MYGMFEYFGEEDAPQRAQREPWNKHKFVGQKKPLKLKEVWGESGRTAVNTRLSTDRTECLLAGFDIASHKRNVLVIRASAAGAFSVRVRSS